MKKSIILNTMSINKCIPHQQLK